MVLNRQFSTRAGPENVIRPRQQLTVAATRILVVEPVFRPFRTVFRSFRKFSAPSVQFSAPSVQFSAPSVQFSAPSDRGALHPSKTQPTVLRFRLKNCENIPPPPAGISPGRGSRHTASPYYTRETHPLPGPLPFSCEGEVHCCRGRKRPIFLPRQDFLHVPG